MKTKPILITATGVLLLVSMIFLVNCRNSVKPEKAEINQFLNSFNRYVKAGNTDSLLACFDADKKLAILKRLVDLLEGKKGLSGKEKPIFNLSLDVDGSEIKYVDAELTVATIPVNLDHDNLEPRHTLLSLKIRKTAPHQYKIIQADARQLLTDYLAYENFVRSKTVEDNDIFSPQTLAAFKTAAELKSKYDSVVWFAHVDKETFFYVVKGKWNMNNDINRYKDSVIDTYEMGLVNPELKEIIPPQYDLIHNISGTFPGLVEVEKDGKKGFYDLYGKIVVPVIYEQIFPIDDDNNLAVLRAGDDYFYLKKDMGISEKVDLKINDFFSKIKNLNNSFDLYSKALLVVTEYNSRTENGSVYISPSYLVDLNMIEKVKNFKNPLRKTTNDDEDGDIHKKYQVSYAGESEEPTSWLTASFYSIRDYFLGGRSEFYDKKNIVIIDKKKDRIFTQDIRSDYTPDEGSGSVDKTCDVNSIKLINDTLFEVKAGAALWIDLYDSTKSIEGGTYYHYLAIEHNKLKELPDNRNFGFTKYVKMDDSYLNGCYSMCIGSGTYDTREKKTIDHITPGMLQYMKNEIYAEYRYQFKDKRWQDIFIDNNAYFNVDKKPNNTNVDDSLTVIDKYNINWINQKLKEGKTKPNTLAAR